MIKTYTYALLCTIIVILSGCTTLRQAYHETFTMTPAQKHQAKMARRKFYGTSDTVFTKHNLPPFNGLDLEGAFHVEIIGNQPKDTVTIKGPVVCPVYVKVYVKNHILHVIAKSYNKSRYWLVQIHLHDLTLLKHRGSGSVNGTNLRSKDLEVIQLGRGSIYLKGRRLKLHKLISKNAGNVTIQNISSNFVVVDKLSSGNVTLSGRIGLRDLRTRGSGSVNISGITPTPLYIYAAGSGPINLTGNVNVREIDLSGSGDININRANTRGLSIKDTGRGNINLTGLVNLYYLYYTGSGDINIYKVRSGNLRIISRGSGKINLTGDVSLSYLDYAGSGDLNVLWIDSDYLTIRMNGDHCGKVMLAGIAEEMTANLSGDATLYAQYLRDNTAHITTRGRAFAEIWVHDVLYARAIEASNIYYYYDPDFKGFYMGNAGAILPQHF